MAWYNAGTASVVNNSVDVTGNLTSWVDNVDAGQAFIGPDGIPYEIATIVSATALKLRKPYRGATAAEQAYAIMPAQGYLMALSKAAAALIQSFDDVRTGIGQGVFPAGSVGIPGFRFLGDENTGITQTGPDTFTVVCGGVEIGTFSDEGLALQALTVAALEIASLKAGALLLGDGTLAAPAAAFTSSPKTGFRRPGADQLAIVTNGADNVLFDADGTTRFYGAARFADGTAASPGGRFHSDPDTGFFRPGDNVLGFATGGIERLRITAGGGIGIGTNAPSEFVEVSRAGSVFTVLKMTNGQGYGKFGVRDAGTAFVESASGKNFEIWGAGQNVTVQHSGNVGIGHSAPADKLTVAGTVRSEGTSSGFRYFSRNGSEEFWIYAENGRARFRSAYSDRFFEFDGYQLFPSLDNATNLGTGSQRFGVVYAATGSIQTSDEQTKEIEENGGTIPDEWLDAWGVVEWCRYKFKDAIDGKGSDARWHVGLIAQRVRDAFAALDLDATEIGLLCYDEWPEEREPIMEERQIDIETVVIERIATGVLDAEGNIIFREVTQDRPIMGMVDSGETRVTREAGNRWGLRYDECQAMEAAWQRRELARKDAAIADLSARLAALESGAS